MISVYFSELGYEETSLNYEIRDIIELIIYQDDMQLGKYKNCKCKSSTNSYYECGKRTKFPLTFMYRSPRRHSNSSKTFRKN